MKWHRDRNGGAGMADGYACSDRIAEHSAAREARSSADQSVACIFFRGGCDAQFPDVFLGVARGELGGRRKLTRSVRSLIEPLPIFAH